MKKKLLLILPIFFLFGSTPIFAHAQINTQINSFRKFKDVDINSIKVPTVVETSFNENYLEILNFAVFDKTDNAFKPYLFKQEVKSYDSILGVSSPQVPGYAIAPIMDGILQTYVDFPLRPNSQGLVQIILTSTDIVSSSALTTLLDNYVALPKYIEITAMVNGQEKIVLAKTAMNENTVHFPKTASDRWSISYWYSQPLRISEIKLVQENSLKNTLNLVRFLAQPGHSYRVYFDPDRLVTSSATGETGNLYLAEDVVKLSKLPIQDNPSYIIADTDNDYIPDIKDNCVSISNLDQADLNTNGVGDVCEDFDLDGILNSIDNCPNIANADQKDRDSDEIGDACDKQESRFTESHPWVPWIGIGFAAVVLICLFALTARAKTDPTH